MLDRLFKIFKSKTPIQTMYPELDEVGGLQNAINIEFEKLNSTLRVSQDSELDKIPLTYARIENGQKFSPLLAQASACAYSKKS